MAGQIRTAVGMHVDVAAGVARGRMVLRDMQNGSLEKWCESVEPGRCLEMFLSQTSMLKTEVLKLGTTDFFHVGELTPRPTTMAKHERTNARASSAHDGDKHVDERKHRTGVFHSP